MDQPQYLTPEGYKNLERRLRNLTEVRRGEIAERLRQSLEEGGDLTENAEYEDAKNEQAFIEGEIQRLEAILNTAEVIADVDGVRDNVTVGAKVTVVEHGTDAQEVYYVVGSAEAQPREGKISVESPLGKALLGAKVRDKVKVKAPDGELVFVIKAIE
jgi:transcription elongation factor GreA